VEFSTTPRNNYQPLLKLQLKLQVLGFSIFGFFLIKKKNGKKAKQRQSETGQKNRIS
jgi:hypothetical protein